MADLQFTADIQPKIDPSQLASGINQIQQQFSKLKLPKELQGKLGTNFDEATKALEKFSAVYNSGIKTKKDFLGLERAGKDARVHLEKIKQQIDSIDTDKLRIEFTADLNKKSFPDIEQRIKEIQKDIRDKFSNIKIGSDVLDANGLESKIKTVSSAFSKLSNASTTAANVLKQDLLAALNTGDFSKMGTDLANVVEKLKNFKNLGETTRNALKGIVQDFQAGEIDKAAASLQSLKIPDAASDNAKKFVANLKEIVEVVQSVKKVDLSNLNKQLEGVESEKATRIRQIVNDIIKDIQNVVPGAQQAIKYLSGMTDELENSGRATANFNSELDNVKSRIQYFFGLTNAVQLLRRALRTTIETVKELDASMTETAVVTDFSVGDMWKQLPQYTATAKQYGVTIKGVYDVMTLYYQQGLNQDQAWQLGTETLKLARIAGLDYAEATDRRHKSYAA